MRPFGYQRAVGARAAVEVFTAATGKVMYLGGGTNLADLMRLGVAEPELLIDVSGLPHRLIEERPGGGIRIGAAARNSDTAAHPLVRRRYPVLSQALLAGASGGFRSAGPTADGRGLSWLAVRVTGPARRGTGCR